MPVSATMRGALAAQETDEVFIVLVTIDHADLSTPIRVSSDGVQTVSRGDTFVACPFDLELPDAGGGIPQARLSVDNVDRQIVQAVRSVSTPPDVTIEIVLASDPDAVEVSLPDFQLVNADYDQLVVSGTLTQESFLNEPYPAGRFTPADFPGLF